MALQSEEVVMVVLAVDGVGEETAITKVMAAAAEMAKAKVLALPPMPRG